MPNHPPPVYPLRQRRLPGRSSLDTVLTPGEIHSTKEGATNGSEDFVSDTVVDGYKVKYSCDRLVRGQDTDVLQVEFDYEVLVQGFNTNVQDFVDNDLPGYEAGMLWAIATNVGLRPCQFNFPVDTLSQTLPIGGSDDDDRHLAVDPPSRIISLSSFDKDIPYTSADGEMGECTFMEYTLDPNTFCVPMTGYVTLEFIGNDRQGTEDYILEHIEQQMNNQMGHVKPVIQTLYLGDRDTYQPSPVLSARESDSGDNVAWASSLSASLVVLFLVVGVFVMRKRRRRLETEIVSKRDIEQGFIDIGNSKTASTSGETLHSHRQAAASIGQVSDHTSSETTADSAAGNDVPQTTKTVEALPPLPPRPASPSSKQVRSQTMKKRRRKKKKKKQTLVRVNSRESITEMEAIPEADEEEKEEIEDEDGSSYYSTDEDSSQGRRSRDPSPSRSLTSTGSDEQPRPPRLLSPPFDDRGRRPRASSPSHSWSSSSDSSVPRSVQVDSSRPPLPPLADGRASPSRSMVTSSSLYAGDVPTSVQIDSRPPLPRYSDAGNQAARRSRDSSRSASPSSVRSDSSESSEDGSRRVVV